MLPPMSFSGSAVLQQYQRCSTRPAHVYLQFISLVMYDSHNVYCNRHFIFLIVPLSLSPPLVTFAYLRPFVGLTLIALHIGQFIIRKVTSDLQWGK